MGEIAEMMLEGMLCEGCGEYLGEGAGFATLCPSCARIYGSEAPAQSQRKRHNKPPLCTSCGRRFAQPTHLQQHQRDTGHGEKP